MAETKNLMGLNLNVDSELMAEAAKEAIIAGVASGLEMIEPGFIRLLVCKIGFVHKYQA